MSKTKSVDLSYGDGRSGGYLMLCGARYGIRIALNTQGSVSPGLRDVIRGTLRTDLLMSGASLWTCFIAIRHFRRAMKVWVTS